MRTRAAPMRPRRASGCSSAWRRSRHGEPERARLMLSRVRRWNALPWFVLGLSLVVTAVATWAALATVQGCIDARFNSAVQSTRDRIEGRLDTYVALLQATAGLFAASRDVRR